MVSRECIYYINLRQAYLLSPLYSTRLSSRTVLFSCVPQSILDEAKIRKIFGDSVKNVWISRDTDELDQLVKEREQTASRLENAEILLIKKANAARAVAVKNGHPFVEVNSPPDIEANAELTTNAPSGKTNDSAGLEAPVLQSQTEALEKQGIKTYGYVPPPDINGSVASQWLPHSERPRHRPLANYFRRVDTIKWTRSRLKILNAKINRLRRQQRLGKGKPIPAVFIEFDSQVNAQGAYQALAHHRALHMSPKFIGVRPYEIVWASLRMRWWELIVRRFSIQAFVTAMIIFWSIPSALIGTISNINFLTSIVPFLGWINDLPGPILGIITGLLPAVALSLLMAIVPAIMRSMYKFLSSLRVKLI
jgi:calcium permeable stress-gated cation channel